MNFDQLSGDAVSLESSYYDWGRMDDWEAFEAAECPGCGEIVVVSARNGACPIEHCFGHIIDVAGPAMNFFYPLPNGCTPDDARKLDGLPLCLVRVNDDLWALALTGGGQDLSWEICEAYMRMGYFPPAYFARLPIMAGMRLDDRHKDILDACITSLEAQISRGKNALSYLKSVEEALRNNG